MTEHTTQTAIVKLSERPPSANNLHKHFVKNGRVMRVKTDKYKGWLKSSGWEIASQRPVKFDVPYHLSIAVQRDWGAKRARDIDNVIKPISDVLVKSGVVRDDSLAESVQAEWSDDATGIWISLSEANIGGTQ